MLRFDKGRIDLSNLRRPPDSRQMLKVAFSKYSCLDCGMCCREGPKHTTMVTIDDPHKMELYRKAREKFPERIRHLPLAGFGIVGGESCAFLDDGRCSVYQERPIVCSLYPFMLQGLRTTTDKGITATMTFLVLTSFCPPLKEALDKGITYVTRGDFSPVKSKRRAVKGIPLLHSSFMRAMGLIKRDIAMDPSNLLVVDDDLVFPLF